MHTTHRTWFPFIIIGVTVLFILFVATYWEPTTPQVSREPLRELPTLVAPTSNAYQAEMKIVLGEFVVTNDVEGAYASLLQFRVPTEFKDLHFDLVVAFGEMRIGNIAEGQARFDLLRKDYPWLNQ